MACALLTGFRMDDDTGKVRLCGMAFITVLAESDCVVKVAFGRWEAERYTESKECTMFYL